MAVVPDQTLGNITSQKTCATQHFGSICNKIDFVQMIEIIVGSNLTLKTSQIQKKISQKETSNLQSCK